MAEDDERGNGGYDSLRSSILSGTVIHEAEPYCHPEDIRKS